MAQQNQQQPVVVVADKDEIKQAQADAQDQANKVKQAVEAKEVAPVAKTYPYDEGQIVVLGQGIFANANLSIINVRGTNYVRQVDAPQSATLAQHLADLRTDAYLAMQEGH